MKRPDLAFWITIVPCVLVWNFVRVPVLEYFAGLEPVGSTQTQPEIWANVSFAAVLGLVAGYGAGLIARPQCLRGAGNIAFGLLVCLGIQNVVDYRDAGLQLFYFVLLPIAAAATALMGGILSELQWRVSASM